ncbi:MAG: PD40 domain-containing protein [Polyangiaceae bacterium]|nr:PD40 domain-containing protein [Polyangiaceae bacterium]
MLTLLRRRFALFTALAIAGVLVAQTASAGPTPPEDETVLGELPITGSSEEHITKLAILPSLSWDMADVVVRGVVRRDFELTGMFDLIDDKKAPPGLYGFRDAVDVDEWKKLGAEVIIKVAAKKTKDGKVEVFGLAYFPSVGTDPVYEKKITVAEDQVRVTAHRVTDGLLGAITGRDGGFASHLTFSGKWGRNRRIFTLDSDGQSLKPVTEETDTSIAPIWGPKGQLFYSRSRKYSPFRLTAFDPAFALKLPFRGSIYSAAFNNDHSKLAIAVAEKGTSKIYVGRADGSGMKKVSTAELATHPVWSPSGKLAYVGGGGKRGTQRIYVDGKPVSPAGFTASAPAFCDTEDGIKLVFAVAVGGNRQDLILTGERGGQMIRLTQNKGSNSYPACSPDGRLLAFFSTRKTGKGPGLYIKSLRRWRSQRISSRVGESLRWAPLPAPPAPPKAAKTPKKAKPPKAKKPAPTKTAAPTSKTSTAASRRTVPAKPRGKPRKPAAGKLAPAGATVTPIPPSEKAPAPRLPAPATPMPAAPATK